MFKKYVSLRTEKMNAKLDGGYGKTENPSLLLRLMPEYSMRWVWLEHSVKREVTSEAIKTGRWSFYAPLKRLSFVLWAMGGRQTTETSVCIDYSDSIEKDRLWSPTAWVNILPPPALWSSYLTSLHLSDLICKKPIIRIPALGAYLWN